MLKIEAVATSIMIQTIIFMASDTLGDSVIRIKKYQNSTLYYGTNQPNYP